VILFTGRLSSQSIPQDSLYLGQTPPGDSAVVFAPGTVSLSNRRETKIVFTPDNLECLIGIGQNSIFQILYTDFHCGYWKTPVPAYFIPNNRPIEPFFSPDSAHVFFTSYADIYMSNLVNQTWSTPFMLASPVSTGYEEYHPTSAQNGTLYFCSMRENASGYIYRSVPENGNYSTVEKLDAAINRNHSGQNGAYDPFIAADESYIIFSCVRPGGYGQDDQYISYNRNGNWTNPKNLGAAINTPAIEYGSYVSPDGKYYFFSRPAGWGPDAAADIYWIKIDNIIDSLMYTDFIPYVRNLIPDQSTLRGQYFNFTIPDSTFVDDDGNNTLTYSAKLANGNPLPSWLAFDTISATFTGTPVNSGTLDIRITAADTAGASDSTTFKLIIGNQTGTGHLREHGLRIFPNPSSGTVTISLDEQSEETALVEISNPEGKLILRESFKNEVNADLAGNPKGIYFLKLLIDDAIMVDKICIR
jgi:hypothetical protein